MDCRHVNMEINQWTADMFIWKLTRTADMFIWKLTNGLQTCLYGN